MWEHCIQRSWRCLFTLFFRECFVSFLRKVSSPFSSWCESRYHWTRKTCDCTRQEPNDALFVRFLLTQRLRLFAPHPWRLNLNMHEILHFELYLVFLAYFSEWYVQINSSVATSNLKKHYTTSVPITGIAVVLVWIRREKGGFGKNPSPPFCSTLSK